MIKEIRSFRGADKDKNKPRDAKELGNITKIC